MTAAVVDQPAVRAPQLRPAPFDGPPLTLERRRAAAPLPSTPPRLRPYPVSPVQGPEITHCRLAPIPALTRGAVTAARTDTRGSVRPISFSRDATTTWWQDVGATGTGELPEVIGWARAICRGLLESFAGRRPVQQLQVHCCPEVFIGVSQYARDCARVPAALVSVAACHPDDGVAEVSAVFRAGPQVRALALRVQGLGGRWCITDRQIG